jgi:hypothetical protein
MRKGIIPAAFAVLIFIVCSDHKAPEQESENILARVNQEVLTYEDIIYQIPPELRPNMTDDYLLEAVETWINTEVVYQKAVEMGLDDEPDVKAAIKWGIKETVAKKYIDQEISSKISISPSEVDSIYQMQKNNYKLEQDRFRASHILLGDYETAMAVYNRLKTGSGFGELVAAMAVYNRLKTGSGFGELVADYSIDRQSAGRGGDIGYFTANQVEEPFAETVKKLKEGSFSKPVRTSYGFHIIMLTERIKAGSELDSFEVKSRIQNQLLAGNEATRFNRVIDSLRTRADIETYPLPGPDNRILQDGQ